MATLEINFKSSDGVAPVIHNITTEIHELNQTTNTAKESGTGFFNGMLSAAGGFLAANVVGSIAGQVKDFIGGSISDAKEAAGIFAQTQAAIESTGHAAGVTAEQVSDMAGQFSAAKGMSLFDDDDILKGDNLLLTFTNITDTLPEATSMMVDMAQALHTDVAGGAIQLGKALNDPIKGITALTRVGVTFTDSQKDQIKALQDAGDMAGAQRIILAELNKEFGGSALAAAKADGGMAQFKAQIGDVGKQIGGALLPVIGQFVSFATTNLMPVLQTAAQWFSDKLPVAIDYVTTTVIPNLVGAWNKIAPVVQTVIGVVGTVIATFQESGTGAGQLGTMIGDLASVWAALQPVIVNVANAVGQVVNAVFGQIQAFIKAHGADIQTTMQDAWARIMEIIKLGAELYNAVIPPVLRFIAKFIQDHGTEIQRILSNTWNSVKAIIDGVLTLIEGAIKVALDLIHGNWSQAWEDLKTMSARIVLDLWTIIKNGLDNVVTVFGSTWTKITDAAKQFVTVTIPDVGKSIVDGLISAVTNGTSALAVAVGHMISKAVSDAVAYFTGGGGGSTPNSLTAQPRVGGPGVGGGGGNTTNTSMKANVTIVASPHQNPHQVAMLAVRQMNRQLSMRRG